VNPADRRQLDRRSGHDRRAGARAGGGRRRADRRKAAGGLLVAVSLMVGAGEGEAAARRSPRPYRGYIDRAAALHGVNPAIVEAVMAVESAYNPRAVSRKGAIGLMQLMPDTAQRFGVQDAFDPEQNILGGTKYLSFLLRLFDGNLDLACAAYNAGERVVQRYGGVPPYRETQQYVQKIRRRLDHGDGPAAAPAPTPKPPFVFYTWMDPRGVLNVSQTPPTGGQKYEKRRLP
jgi:transglycosylase-like protein with SLT domain